jgi:anti-sigma factor RsiW
MIEFAGAATAASRSAARDDERELAMSLSRSNARQVANRPAEPAIESDKSFAAGWPAGAGRLAARGFGARVGLTSKSDWTTA